MNDSRMSGLYSLGVAERIGELRRRGWLSPEAAQDLLSGRQVLSVVAADSMIENVIGVFGLPLAIAPNFIVNGRECVVPLVVEEPSIVAALSNAAALARAAGGFTAHSDESLLAGQIHLVGMTDCASSVAALQAASSELLELAEQVHPRLTTRGGGVRDIEVRKLELQNAAPLIVVHVLVDTCDAMGANLVNTICESIAPRVAELCDGEVALRILSNLADRAIVRATVQYASAVLATSTMTGEQVRDRIVTASEIALVDPHRAATHNKGVMNGIDALAIATGNDWRALEAGVHAYAARSGQYAAVTRWSVGAKGDLLGEIEVPLKPGIVGGTTASNFAAKLGLAIAAPATAQQLAELMAAVGLAQNFSALRALASSGIQQGHMRLHARSVANAAGVPEDRLDLVADKLVESGEVKDWKAVEILAELDAVQSDEGAVTASAAGKVILSGEHAVVYGHHALAVPIPDAVQAAVAMSDRGTTLTVPDWGLHHCVDPQSDGGVDAIVSLIMRQLGVAQSNFSIRVSSILPRGMGLGSSAAIAVAVTRAIARCMSIDLDDCKTNEIVFACEKLAHGTPSGIDNTICCYGEAILFRRDDEPRVEVLRLLETPPLVIGFSHEAGRTLDQVAGVRKRRERNRRAYDAIFEQIDKISLSGAKLLAGEKYDELGQMMNLSHGLLNAIEVSTPELETMVAVARESGAVGAKLTGAGGGGSIVALCPGVEEQVCSALRQAGYRTLRVSSAVGVAT